MAKRVISAVLSFKDQNFSKGMKKANKDAGEFGRYMQTAQNKASEFNKKATKAFKAVGVAAGALAAGGIAAVSVSVGKMVTEMDTAYSKLEARTGAVGAQLEGYKDISKEVFVNGLTDSISESSNAVGKLATMFKNLDMKELSNVTQGSFTIAKVFDQEATEVGRAVKALMTNFEGLGASDATDLITTAFQKTGDYANDVLDTFSEYSGYFSDVGMSAEQFTSTLIKGADAGAWNIDKVGDAVKEFGIRATDGSKGTAAAYATIGLKASEMAKKIGQGGETANQAYMATIAGLSGIKSEVKRNEAGVALFGTMWEDLRDDVIMSMGDSTSAVEGYQGATEKALDRLNKGPVARMKNGWRTLVTSVSDMVATNPDVQNFTGSIVSGFEKSVPLIISAISTTAEFANTIKDRLAPHVQTIITKATEFAKTIKDNWGPISNVVLGAAVAVTTFKVAVTGLTIISKVAGFIKVFRGALMAGTVAQWAMNVAMLASPMTWVAVGIAGLVAAGVLLWKNWDTVSVKMGKAWDVIKSSAATAINFVIDGINALIKTINRIPGVNIPIVAKVDWGNTGPPKGLANASEVAKSANVRNWETMPSFAVGTNRVTSDMAANIHKDEMILPSRQADKVRSVGGNIDNIDKLITTGSTSTKGNSTSSKSGNTINFYGGITVQGGDGTEAAVKEFVHQVELQLANM